MTKKPFTFGIFNKRATPIYLLASSEQEMDLWTKTLESVVSILKIIQINLTFQ